MNSQIAAIRVGATVFALVCIGHLWRVVTHAQMVIGNYQVPVWTSVLVVLITGVLSIWLWRASQQRSRQADL